MKSPVNSNLPTTRRRGVLLLSHQGLSFMEDLIAICGELGLEAYVISSKPRDSNAGRRTFLQGATHWTRFSECPNLVLADAVQVLETLQALGHEVAACISVWDGYRHIMAAINHMLGAPDLAPEKVTLLVDKLAMRQKLYDFGLTGGNARLISPDALATLDPSKRWFAKPRRGLASYGTFEITSRTPWQTISDLLHEARGDEEYGAIIGEYGEYIVEPYLEGLEFSFEILAQENHVAIVGIHEKCALEERSRTVLETACISPPVSISEADVARGKAYIKEVFSGLGLDEGCFHVEARFSPLQRAWDIVEINPRIGGAMIHPSIKLTCGVDLLALQIKRLTALERPRQEDIPRDGAPKCRSFFRVFFAEPQLRLKRVTVSAMAPKPIAHKVSGQADQSPAPSSREVFLGQAMWQLPLHFSERSLKRIMTKTRDFLEIEYESEATAYHRRL